MLSGDTNIESLPDELLFDIFVRLAVDYLYETARLVCRRWRHIIQYSNAFTSSHFQQHSTYGLVLLFPSTSPPHSIYATATQDGGIEIADLSYICKNKTSANGLLVEFNSRGLYVINPATKQSFRLPSLFVPRRSSTTAYHSKCGIAYSAASMEYKVTLPYSTTFEDGLLQVGLNIVTVGVDKSWRRVEIPPGCGTGKPYYDAPLSSEGFLHWGSGRYCLTLNVETEIFTMSEVPLPACDLDDYFYRPTGRYLSLLVRCRRELCWEVWEMRPAEGGEWRKLVLPHIHLNPLLFPLGWVKYPEVLAFCFWNDRKACIFYNLKTHETSTIDLPNSSRVYQIAIVHRNSLVWLS